MTNRQIIHILRLAIKALESKPNFVVAIGLTSAIVIGNLKDLLKEIENDLPVQG
jgi:hypothetical protein